MGRNPTTAANSPFYKARIKAGKFNNKLSSRAGAAELLGVSESTVSDYELGLTKVIPPDIVVKMADLYNAPELRNYYCCEICPIGWDMPKVEIEDLDRITIKALATFKNISVQKEKLLEIAADGVITEDEKPDFIKIVQSMDELAAIATSLKMWAERNLKGGS